MFCYGNIFISFLHGIRCHLLQSMDAVTLACMHMEVAFYIMNLYEPWQFAFFSGLNLSHIFPQLRRDKRQTHRLIDIFFCPARKPLLRPLIKAFRGRLFLKHAIFAYFKAHLLCPVANSDIVSL